jgi:hypothetical protein
MLRGFNNSYSGRIFRGCNHPIFNTRCHQSKAEFKSWNCCRDGGARSLKNEGSWWKIQD